MPIYEYEAADPDRSCDRCRGPFEVLHGVHESPLARCPRCGADVRKLISWCRAAVVEASQEGARVEQTVGEYERAGMWSHAAELADTHSEKTGDSSLKGRALEAYRKAGYDTDSLIRNSKG